MPMAQPRRLLTLGLLAVCWTLIGCTDSDLTHTPKYAGVIGAEYRTKTELYALGVYRSDDSRQLGWISISPVQQTGPEIAFHRKIPVGHVVRVVGVRKRFVLLENGLEFLVATDGLDLPPGIEIVILLYAYMPTTDGFPDQTRFERVGTRVQ